MCCIFMFNLLTDLKKKDNLLLYQTKMNPPHFKVILEDDTWDIQKVSDSTSYLSSRQFAVIGMDFYVYATLSPSRKFQWDVT